MASMVSEDDNRHQLIEFYRVAGFMCLAGAFPFLLIVAILNGDIAIRFVLLMIGACLFFIGTILFLLAKFEKGERKNEKEKACPDSLYYRYASFNFSTSFSLKR